MDTETTATIKKLFDVLNTLPDEIKAEDQKIIMLSIQKETFEIALATQERIATMEIIFAKDGGKPLYSNDLSRQTAIADKLATTIDYTNVKLQLMEINKQMMEAKMEKDYHYNRLKGLGFMVSLLQMEG